MHKMLQGIISSTALEISKRKKEVFKKNSISFTHLSFKEIVLNFKIGDIGLIAEIKLASPTERQLGEKGDLLDRLQAYQNAGADAVSIITENRFFKGNPQLVTTAKRSILLPILQKDFVIDDFQIDESHRLGADALLLIAKIVDKDKLRRFVKLCKDKALEPVVEIDNMADLEKAVESGTDIIAVNARNLDTFDVSLVKACELLKKIPHKFIKLGFSGIHSRRDIEKYKQAGANAVLVGTELMRTKNINRFIKELKNVN